MNTPKYSVKTIDHHIDNSQSANANIDALFPLPRYFQVHFEYIHDNMAEFHHQADQLQQRINELNAKLDRVLRLLGANLN